MKKGDDDILTVRLGNEDKFSMKSPTRLQRPAAVP